MALSLMSVFQLEDDLSRYTLSVGVTTMIKLLTIFFLLIARVSIRFANKKLHNYKNY